MTMTTFAITAAVNSIRLDAGGRGEVSYTVSNTSGRPLRGRARIVPPQEAPADCFTIIGAAERDFAAAGTQQYNIQITLPLGVKAGRYLLKLDMVGVKNPDEEFASGPPITFEVRSQEPVKKPFPWWVVAVGLGALVVLAGLIFGVTGAIGDGAPLTTLPEILQAMEVQDLAVDRAILIRGQTVSFTYNLVNTSRNSVIPSTDNTFSLPLVGARQHWVERLGSEKSISAFAASTARDGDRFAIGGAIIAAEGELLAGEALSFTETLNTTGFPRDRYRISVEYRDLDGRVVQTATADFEVR